MRQEQGFVLPLLAGLLSASATLVLVQLTLTLKPPAHTQGRRATERECRLARASESIWRRDGRLPTTIQEIETSGLLATVPRTTADPYSPHPLHLQRAGLESDLVSAGPDGRIGTPDDVRQRTRIRVLAYAHDRARLARLRLLFFRGPQVRTKTATPAVVKSLRLAMEAAAAHRRSAAFNTGRARADALRLARKQESKITQLLRALGGPPLPAQVGGADGLLQRLGLPEALGRSAFGGTFYVSPLGFSSAGADGKARTDDDL